MDKTEACLGSENYRSLSRRGLRVVAGEGKEGVAIHVRGEEWVGLGLTGVSGNRHMGRDDTCPESFWANGPVQLLLQV